MLGGVLLSGNFFVEMEISGAFRDYDAMMVFLWDMICLELVDDKNTEWWLDEVVIITQFTLCFPITS